MARLSHPRALSCQPLLLPFPNLWSQVSSFFTPAMLESKAYRVGQKVAALWALSQFLVSAQPGRSEVS